MANRRSQISPMGDELDEIDNSGALINKTRTIIIDLQNLDEPIRHFDYVSDTDAIDHNGYVKGSKFFRLVTPLVLGL